ncbi:PREDICTED: F-box/kelch-repeat protein At3g23880-like [Nicotiana attenuata]|uniref:F-boxkelch-repeat protein n=1 Tax=Nicotiana attenuata TaxID=49451 RepID=A0A1J6JRL9_NICAT|nr:PREDICTED: F-box/kelch-repeat protein At3g23880-like [Nicotiana attenuata]OIT20413.1 f-boxkelch-repeat protein [Nicotiana attenuata]
MLTLLCKENLKLCSLGSLLYEFVTEAFDFDYPIKYPFDTAWIVGSVNGLICLKNAKEYLLLWNPSIRKLKKVTSFVAAPTPTPGRYRYGFGYDELNDDYKLVSAFYSTNGRSDVKVNMYSLNSDHSWRRIDDFPDGVLLGSAKSVDGKLHWITTGSCPGCNDRVIISIDLAGEKWGKLEQPCYGVEYFLLWLGVLFCKYYERNCIDVWVMKEYGVKESWTRMYTIEFRPDVENSVPSPPLCMSDKGEIVLVFGSTFMIYNPKDGLIRYLEVANIRFCIAGIVYIESLVCPIL